MNNPVILEFIKLIPFEGLKMETLLKAAETAGRPEDICDFPNGIDSVIYDLGKYFDKMAADRIQNMPLDTMRVRDKIFESVKLRISIYEEEIPSYREVMGSIMKYYLKKGKVMLASNVVYNTLDNIWFSIGDKSTDFNFYTKRATLFLVYVSTLTKFLSDYSTSHQKTWDFLSNRIDNVMTFHKYKAKVKNLFFRRKGAKL